MLVKLSRNKSLFWKSGRETRDMAWGSASLGCPHWYGQPCTLVVLYLKYKASLSDMSVSGDRWLCTIFRFCVLEGVLTG